MDKQHELSAPLRTTTIHRAYRVFKDYDGEAPDGPTYCICATEELADEMVEILGTLDKDGPFGTEDGAIPEEALAVIAKLKEHLRPHATEIAKESSTGDFGWPFDDGNESVAYWRSAACETEKGKIATTLAEATAQALDAY